MKIIANLFILSAVVFFVACEDMGNNRNAGNDTTGIRSPGYDTDTTGSAWNRNEDFVTDVIENYERERTWLQAGINKGSSAEVKDMARELMEDHKSMIQTLGVFARNNNINIPDTTDTNLASLAESAEREIIGITAKGSRWDEEWADEVGDELESLVRRFERARDNVNHNELRDFIDRQLPQLREDLEQARELENKLNRQQ